MSGMWFGVAPRIYTTKHMCLKRLVDMLKMQITIWSFVNKDIHVSSKYYNNNGYRLKLDTMIRENRQLVKDEPVDLRNNWLRFKTAGKLPIILEEFIEYTLI